MGYLVVDAADESIIAHTESLEDLLRIVQQTKSKEPERDLLFGRFDEHAGELISTRSIVTARALTAWEGLATFGRQR